MRVFNLSLIIIALALTAPIAAVAKPMKGAVLASQASVTLATARAAALKVHAGKITDEELEKEDGGSGLRYSFDIKQGTETYEVGIDAKTGAVLENKAEGKNPD